MIPRFRIYDKEVGYYVSNTRFLLSMDGQLLDTYDTTWHGVGERYIVEFSIGKLDSSQVEIYEGNVISYHDATGYIFYDSESSMYMVRSSLNRSNYSFDSLDQSHKIIGTIHDEKYKNL